MDLGALLRFSGSIILKLVSLLPALHDRWEERAPLELKAMAERDGRWVWRPIVSTDMLPETQLQPRRRRAPRPADAPRSSLSRHWKLGLGATGLAAVAVIAALWIPGLRTSQDTGPQLTHKITRGDLIVSVTEQGTLESSNNTEIRCKVRGYSTVIWVIEGGSEVQPGDELVRLDTKAIEDAVSLQTTNAHTARATLEQSKAEVAKAEIAISAYLEGTYRSQYESLERELKIAEANLLTAQKMLEQSEKLFKLGYVTDLEVEGNTFTVTQAELELKVKQTQLQVLEEYTKKMELETLNGNLIASKSKLEADKAGLAMDEGRRDRALEELGYCVMKAEKPGLVILPSAAQWKNAPDITEGATVHKDQVLLLMPDLTKMQVKVGIHESIVDRIKPGMIAKVTLPDKSLEGKVSSVSSVTRPAGWWTGNVVKYDTIVELPSVPGLKPGMSAEVEIIIDRHENVLTIPVAAVVETAEGDFCWVKTADGTRRRSLQLGDTDDSFIVVQAGLKEGDEVALNPLSFLKEVQAEVRQPAGEVEPPAVDSGRPGAETRQPEQREAADGN